MPISTLLAAALLMASESVALLPMPPALAHPGRIVCMRTIYYSDRNHGQVVGITSHCTGGRLTRTGHVSPYSTSEPIPEIAGSAGAAETSVEISLPQAPATSNGPVIPDDPMRAVEPLHRKMSNGTIRQPPGPSPDSFQ